MSRALTIRAVLLRDGLGNWTLAGSSDEPVASRADAAKFVEKWNLDAMDEMSYADISIITIQAPDLEPREVVGDVFKSDAIRSAWGGFLDMAIDEELDEMRAIFDEKAAAK